VQRANRIWQTRRAAALALTFGRDVLFPWLRAQEVDHVSYRCLGSELPIRDIVPLHHTTHALVTRLRERGHRKAVNAVLRGAAILWVVAELGVVSWIVSTILR
jgi:hypothetical protein